MEIMTDSARETSITIALTLMVNAETRQEKRQHWHQAAKLINDRSQAQIAMMEGFLHE